MIVEQDRYIEVMGESSYIEQVALYRFDLNITVRASKGDTALEETGELREVVFQSLLTSGLSQHEISEGSAELWRSWLWHRKAGQEAHQKIAIEVSDFGRFAQAASSLEPVFLNPRYSLSIFSREPVFEAKDDDKNQCRRAALQDAREKAEVIAAESYVQLGSVIQVQQIFPMTDKQEVKPYNNGNNGVTITMGNMGKEGDPDVPIISMDETTREIKVKFRVRYQIGA